MSSVVIAKKIHQKKCPVFTCQKLHGTNIDTHVDDDYLTPEKVVHDRHFWRTLIT